MNDQPETVIIDSWQEDLIEKVEAGGDPGQEIGDLAAPVLAEPDDAA